MTVGYIKHTPLGQDLKEEVGKRLANLERLDLSTLMWVAQKFGVNERIVNEQVVDEQVVNKRSVDERINKEYGHEYYDGAVFCGSKERACILAIAHGHFIKNTSGKADVSQKEWLRASLPFITALVRELYNAREYRINWLEDYPDRERYKENFDVIKEVLNGYLADTGMHDSEKLERALDTIHTAQWIPDAPHSAPAPGM